MIATVLAYFRERLRPALFAPVILLLALAACWASNAMNLPLFARAVGLMTLVVTQFRLWDDLADRERDRLTHSGRVLVRADARPFKILAAVLAIAGLGTAWRLGGMSPLVALAALNATFVVLYALVRPHLSETIWQFPVLLAKYPAFVAIVAGAVGAPAAGRMASAALLAYGGALAYEALHSRRASAPPTHEH